MRPGGAKRKRSPCQHITVESGLVKKSDTEESLGGGDMLAREHFE